MTERRPLLIIDGDNMAHRAYHSTPKSVKGANDQVINAVVGFFGIVLRVYQAEKPRAVFICWDRLGVDTYRSEIWPAYQGGRIFDQEIRDQLEILPHLCEAFGFGVGKQGGYEADDFGATILKKEVADGGTCIWFTTDKDSYQYVSDKVTVVSPRKGNPEPERVGPHQVVEKFGVLPEQVADFKALSGDPSDKIPGIRGVGPKAAAALLLKYGALENIYEVWTNPKDIELVKIFREVVRMREDAPCELPKSGTPDWKGGAAALRVLGANTLADRIESTFGV